MDSKITLSFDKEAIAKAKKFANAHHLSLSRLTEFLYRRITSQHFKGLEELPLTEWVSEVAEGETEYYRKSRSRKSLKKEYFPTRK